MNSDLLDIGSQCQLEDCPQVDFLPIKCSCGLQFCREHILPDAHACRIQAAAAPHSSKPLEKFQRCALEGCNKASLDAFSADETKTSAACPKCTLAFCAEHRYPETHSCSPVSSSLPTSDGKNSTAKALLAKHFTGPKVAGGSSGTSARGAPKIPTDPVKLAQYRKVELMKMRHRAVPADLKDKPTSVPVGERFHIQLRVEKQDDMKVYWVRKSIVTGKALDLLAAQAKVTTSPLRLFHVTDERQLENSQALASQVEDGDVLVLKSPI